MTTLDDAPTGHPRPPLTKARIVGAAVQFADEHGLEALSMRKLARALGYEVMSLYNHVANKDEIIDAMLDAVAAEMPVPTPGADWKAELRRSMIGGLRVMQAHPWAVPLWNARMPGPARLALMDTVLATLMAAGLTDEMADHGFHALNTYLQGFALQQQTFVVPMRGDMADVLERFKQMLDGRYPALHTHIEWHQTSPEANEFEFVLDLILNGLEP